MGVAETCRVSWTWSVIAPGATSTDATVFVAGGGVPPPPGPMGPGSPLHAAATARTARAAILPALSFHCMLFVRM
jgi:hypothetical protein